MESALGSSARSDRAAGCVLALLGVRNVAELVVPDAAYVPTNVAVGAALVALARASGTSWDELGLDRRQLGRGLAVGSVAAAGAVSGMLALAAVPGPRRLFDDERVPRHARPSERLHQTVVRIPVGTVAFEELAFRGVLLGLLRRRLPVGAAITVDSALFGLWHIVPTRATARANGITGLRRVALVTGSVLATAAGGVALCGLRIAAGHLLAPALVHLGFNDAGYLLAWRVRTGG